MLETADELVFVDIPVAERAVVVVALSEPAVVHDEHFDAELLGGFGEVDQLVAVKIEVRRFPAVDEQGTLGGLVFAADEVMAVEAVENAAHFAQTLVRKHADRLGREERVARLERPL